MTAIEWTDATWNPIVGCSIVSPGCTNCYAMKMAARLEAMGTIPHYAGTTKANKAGAVWTGKLALAPEATLLAPLRRRKPTMYFVNSMGDLFHEDVPDEWIDRVFAIMALAPQHTFQILTKRAARMREYVYPAFDRVIRQMMLLVEHGYPTVRQTCEALGLPYTQPQTAEDWYPLQNVWLGVSAEDQRRADERVPDLLATPAAVRFVSAEPLLGPIYFAKLDMLYQLGQQAFMDALDGGLYVELPRPPKPRFPFRDVAKLDWVIVGGESGPDSRPSSRLWVRAIRDQCAAAGTAFFFKQWGGWRREAAFNTAATPEMIPGALIPSGRSILAVEIVEGGIAKGGVLRREGKKKAGRILDGIEHNAMPGARP